MHDGPQTCPSSSPTEDDARLADLVEEITRRMDRGEVVDASDYLVQHPDLAEQLTELIPAVTALGALGISANRSPLTDGLCDKTLSSEFRRLGDFQIQREISRGGMGIVYEARQLSLGRRVALKVLPVASMLDQRQLVRFQTEVHAAASLQHPNIVPVHSVGSDRGVHYYAMQYIDGQSLACVLKELKQEVDAATPSSSVSRAAASLEASDFCARSFRRSADYGRAVARLGIQAAEGFHHAHQHGIIHRDVKPGNLLLDKQQRLWVTDFGLARVEQDSQLTATGDLVGTLRYMSPEQAGGVNRTVDHRTDIYSLGATLYEMLTLRPAFDDEGRRDLLTQIALSDPPLPSRLNPRVPADLETIVLKAMDKDPNGRYDTAADLAGDLRRFLEYRPILARRPTRIARFSKWLRRHPALVNSLFAAVVLIAVGSAISSLLILQQRGETERALQKAQLNFLQSETNRELAEQARDQMERSLYVRGLGLAAHAWHDGDSIGAAALLRANPAFRDRPELRGFEWDYLQSMLATKHQLLSQQPQEWTATAWSSDGLYVASADDQGTIQLWTTENWQRHATLSGHTAAVHALVFSPTGDQLASCSEDGTVRLWHVARAQETRRIKDAHGGAAVFSVAYSPDASRLLSGGADNEARLWELPAMQPRGRLRGHSREIRSVAYSDDGRKIATASNDRDVRLWNAGSGELLATCQGHSGMVLSVCFTANGQYLVSGSNDHTIRLWNASDGQLLAVLEQQHDGVQTLAALPDGNDFVTGDRGGQMRRWHVQGKRLIDRWQLRDHEHFHAVQLAPGGRYWAGLTSDGRLLLRDLATKRTKVVQQGIEVDYPLSHSETVAFSPDGKRLYCSSGLLLQVESKRDDWSTSIPLDIRAGAAGHFSPDGQHLATAWDCTIKLWRAEDGKVVASLRSPVNSLAGVRFSPDGKHVASWGTVGPIIIWDWQAGDSIRRLAHPGLESPGPRLLDLQYSPDGRKIAVCTEAGRVYLWDENEHAWEPVDVDGRSVAFLRWLHEGKALAMGVRGGADWIHWLDGTGREEVIGFNQDSQGLLICEASRQFLCNDDDLGVVVRDLDQLEVVSGVNDCLIGHQDRVWSTSVSPDGTQIISSGRDGSLRLWTPHTDRWRWLTQAWHPEDGVEDFAWTESDGALMIAHRQRIMLQDWPSGSASAEMRWHDIGRVAPFPLGASTITSSCDSKLIATGHRDGRIRIWDDSTAAVAKELAAFPVNHGVSKLRFSPCARWLLASCHVGNLLKIYCTDTWQEVLSRPADDCDDFALSSDGRYLAYCDGPEAVWLEMQTWRERRRFREHSLTVHGVALSPDDQRLVTACEDRKLRVWDTSSGELLQTFSGHGESIQQVTFSPDGRTLVSGDALGAIKLWSLETGQELFTLARLGAGIRKLAFDPSGQVLLARTKQGQVHVFNARPDR